MSHGGTVQDVLRQGIIFRLSEFYTAQEAPQQAMVYRLQIPFRVHNKGFPYRLFEHLVLTSFYPHQGQEAPFHMTYQALTLHYRYI